MTLEEELNELKQQYREVESELDRTMDNYLAAERRFPNEREKITRLEHELGVLQRKIEIKKHDIRMSNQ